MSKHENLSKIILTDKYGRVYEEKIIDCASDTALITFNYEYDGKHRLIKETDYDSYNNKVTVDFEYDSSNRIVSVRDEFDNGNHIYFESERYTYDEKGRVIQKNSAYSSTPETTVVTDYFYDENGNLIKSVKTHSFGSVDVIEYKYDSENRKIQKTEFDDEGNEYRVVKFSYDSSGNVIRKEDTSEKLCIADEFFYKNGKKIRKIREWLNSEKEVLHKSEYEYVYDSEGKIIYRICNNDDFNTSKYLYNSFGRLAVEDCFNEKYHKRNIYFGHFGTIFSTFEYGYDSDGSCIYESSQRIDGT